MHRRWRVRHSYPQPVVELVRLLLPLHAVREISGVLDIPMSVIYRWRALERDSGVASEGNVADATTISSAVARCHELGFRFTDRPAAANRPLWPSPLPAQPLPEVSTSVREMPGQMSDAAGPVDDGTQARDTARDVAELRSGLCAPEQRYTFDARKERSTRRVRQRLEAARRMIDVEYFFGNRLQDSGRCSTDVAPPFHPHVQPSVRIDAASVLDPHASGSCQATPAGVSRTDRSDCDRGRLPLGPELEPGVQADRRRKRVEILQRHRQT
jgi:hypothetical protein